MRGPTPALGDHTAEVLAELGYTEEQVAVMLAAAANGGGV